MITHYIKVTLRKLGKNYIFASINIGGLVIALATAFLIFHFVLSELTTDHFHKNKDDIYRTVIQFGQGTDDVFSIYGSTYNLSEEIHDKLPEIVNISRTLYNWGQYIVTEKGSIRASNFLMADPSFFNVFTIDIINGDRNNLINKPFSIVLSESMSKKYFPNENPVGKTLRIEKNNESKPFLITGVFKDLQENSSIYADFISYLGNQSTGGRSANEVDTYIQLKKGSNPKLFQNKLNELKVYEYQGNNYAYFLQRLTDIYFHSDFLSYYNGVTGNYKLILIYTIVGILILLIASINYIIITTASSTERMTEIGIRKVLGAKKSTIIRQLLIESLLISSIALPLAIIVSEFASPIFNNLIGKELKVHYFENWYYIAGIFLITLCISLLSGIYISLYVSSFSPEKALKKQFSKTRKNFDFRKTLIAIQIIIFMILFSFSSLMITQINYLNHKNIGYDFNNLISITISHNNYNSNYDVFMNEIAKNPSVESSSEVFAGIFSNVNMRYPFVGSKNPESEITVKMLQGDYNYISTLKCNLIEGRNFNPNMSSDTAAIILNQTAVSKLSLQNSIGEVLTDPKGKRFIIIGVVEDFNFSSMHSLIIPMGFFMQQTTTQTRQILVRINPDNYKQTINFLEKTWSKYAPSSKFSYHFFQDSLESQYVDEKRFSKTIKILTILTILIAAFGIFGFSFYNARQRIKEIGIRKVYGATAVNILKMVYKELILLVSISGIIAFPLSYLVSDRWLNNYAYQIDFPYWIFLMVFIISISIVLITTGVTVYNAANKNPVDSLRYE